MFGMRLFCLALSLLGACYGPDLSGVKYTCGPINPICPEGLSCTDGLCQLPGKSGGKDLGPSGNIPDGSTPVAGCRSGSGYKVGSAYACPGAFSPAAPASQLCARGLQLCTNSSGVDFALCKTLPGFYAAVRIHRDPGQPVDPATFACGSPNGPQLRMFAGCGRTEASMIFDLPSAVQQCSTFNQAIDCQQAGWSCPSSTLDNDTQNSSTDGVLCC